MFDGPVTIHSQSQSDVGPDDLDDLLSFLRQHGAGEFDPYALQKAFPVVKQEPVTIGIAVIVGTPAVAKSLARLVERWLKERERTRQKALTLAAAKSSDETGGLRITIERGFKKDVLTIEDFSRVAEQDQGEDTA
jgi:hypothetical protein